MQGSVLSKTFDVFSLPVPCRAPTGTVYAVKQGNSFLASLRLFFYCHISKVSGDFSNRVLSMVIACVVWGGALQGLLVNTSS